MFDLPTWRGSIEPRRFGCGSWSDHVPFAFDLVAALRPAVIVELGTHRGESYFAFCQSVQENATGSRCYAVDTWQGDEHAGRYGEEIFQSVSSHNAQHHADFSLLIRETFDEAARQFSDGSIDLLHLDGLHTYEAVRHDFESWRSKLRPGGIILLHDTAVRSGNFGVWRWWEELVASGTGGGFEFHHGYGLGAFSPDGRFPDEPLLRTMFRGSAAEKDRLRAHYGDVARDLRRRIPRVPAAGEASVQIYFAAEGELFSEVDSVSVELPPCVRQTVTLRLPLDFSTGALRVDPMRCPGIIDLYGVRILGLADERPVWSARGAEVLATLIVAGTATAIRRGEALRIFSLGGDPHLGLPRIDAGSAARPLRIEIDLCVQPMTAESADAAVRSAAFHDLGGMT